MIVGCMRVKNEARFITKAIRSIQPICKHIIVFDDHSTDGTPQFVSALQGATVIRSPFEGLNESRDKTALVGAIRELGHKSWVLMIDGDEELVGECLEMQPFAPAYTFRVAYLWDREDQERVDGVYANLTRPSLFDLSRTDGVFQSTGSGGNFHCGNVPTDLRGKSRPSGAVLKHYGYMHRADRIKKHEFYNRVDPGNSAEDFYNHVLIGDTFPADSVFKHGGPLDLRPFP